MFGLGEILVIVGLFALALLFRVAARSRRAQEEKRKHARTNSRPDWLADMGAGEKPKRESHYTIGDDGELVEVPEDSSRDSPQREQKA
ncbi:MAG: hypothetical protein H6672_12990 [Anaerolineaceae bacterium]|nr:hypothetical protein [Anaerolineaceae bacterium]